jgi:beta-ureidopropionase
MPRIVRIGLIQATLPEGATGAVHPIKKAMIDKHVEMIAQAAHRGAQVVCLQELFCGPYFCAEQDAKWRDLAEPIPDGPTVQLMSEIAHQHRMVLVVPLAEEDITGVQYNSAAVIDADGSYLGTYRKVHLPHGPPGFWEKFFFKPGDRGYPVFETRFGRIGVYLCYDRHFPEGARALGLNGAEIVFNPSAGIAGPGEALWKIELPAHAVMNQYFVAGVNRAGTEAPWRIGEFFGTSYVCNPRGQIVAEGKRAEDDVVLAEVDLDEIREVRHAMPFLRDRRPDTYDDLLLP